MEPYDLVVIGGGSAGYAAARTAVGFELRTAVVDGAEELGGLCILRGCMPSKALIESANRNLVIRRAAEFGLGVAPAAVDASAVFGRKASLIAGFAGYRRGQLEDGRFDLVRGTARFLSADRVEVEPRAGGEAEVLGARAVVIATGSEVARPAVPGLDLPSIWTSDEALSAGRIPSSLAVLGGGAIALEMAHFFDGLGSAVTVVQRGEHLLTGIDHDIADALERALRRRGIAIHTGTVLEAVEATAGSHRVRFWQAGEEVVIDAEAVLLALGRRPATGRLGLGNAGVDSREDGTVVADAEQRTSQPRVFAAGDACGPFEVVHTAVVQGEVAATNAAVALGVLPAARRRRTDHRLRLLGIFTQPQVATIGLTEAEAARDGHDVAVARYPFDDHGKSIVMGETEGFVKLLADRRSGEIAGAAAVGPEVVELIHEIAVAMHFRATAADLAAVPHYHPTLSEIWTYPAEELAGT
jgi:pyruvate/2-oxoglutarate dehydrogenase complex dihydrolipoamide dehydrogenase (E3) component